jgi:hypothetical protein
VYDDTIYSSGVPAYTYHTDYYHNGINYDSSITIQTTLATNTTTTNFKSYTHQNALNQTDTLWYVYYNGSGTYSSTSKDVTTYNANNLLDSMIFYTSQAPTWYKAAKREYTYNANNQKIKLIINGFDQLSQQYQPMARDEYIRTNGVEMDTIYTQLWNTGFSVYDTTVKKGYIYTAGHLSKIYTFTRETVTNNWIPNPYAAINNYYYNIPLSIGHIQKEKSKLTLYPNPASNELHILEDFQQVAYSILSTDGKLMQHGILNDQNLISIEFIAKGAYFLILETNGQTISRMFHKQ